MTKRECIDYVADQQEKSWLMPTNYLKRTEAYSHCKEVCKRNGYVDGAFDQIWIAAIRKSAIKDGLYRG